MPGNTLVNVWQLPYGKDSLSYRHHRHQFFMLLWVTGGFGEHQVAFRNHPLLPGRVLFVQEGLAHRVLQQPETGWLILFHPDIFHRFLRHHPADEQHGLFDFLTPLPYIDLDPATAVTFAQILPLLAAESAAYPQHTLAADLIGILLYAANRLHQPVHPALLHPGQAEQVRQLKMLIERHYLIHRGAPFYAEKLGLSARKLNQLASKLTGSNVDELVEARIIAEAESLLGVTAFTIKEIAFQLNFISQSHFAYFFRRRKRISPKAFRKLHQDKF
ncbi:AraC-like DNA-binding protein [Mucilaginibacter gracilis]|uniref:AraC-like DNA-binding protein n=2 Tax=Mucilaginibacter gracilis TaxID=423350 RepID=A0A495IZE6_9SPHI|nr:AraC-like DNA-binding protein [Mucilaginibacter gracilis]